MTFALAALYSAATVGGLICATFIGAMFWHFLTERFAQK